MIPEASPVPPAGKMFALLIGGAAALVGLLLLRVGDRPAAAQPAAVERPAAPSAWREIEPVPLGFAPACLASDPRGGFLVGGDGAIERFDAAGRPAGRTATPETPVALCALADGRLIVALPRAVLIEEDGGWRRIGLPGTAQVVSLAASAAEGRIWVSDSGERCVLAFRLDGEPAGRLAETDPDRPGERGILLYASPRFDVACGADGRLRIADPGRHRLLLFSPGGERVSVWPSQPSDRESGFAGCCNPGDFALLPDGGVVTFEKGLPRLKIHDADGTFRERIADRDAFAPSPRSVDVAVAGDGAVLVLDEAGRRIRRFARRPETGR